MEITPAMLISIRPQTPTAPAKDTADGAKARDVERDDSAAFAACFAGMAAPVPMPAASAGESPAPDGAEGKVALEQALAADGGETGLASGTAEVGDPIDPIVEADHRGAILAVIRLGRKDMELEANELGVMQTNYQQGLGIAPGYSPVPFNQGGAAPGYISGVTGPAYGMPITGTPIGLPGPPHIPLGVPAGLQQHTIHNHTPMHIPGPTPQLDIHLRQDPGLSYPRPVDTVRIREQTIRPLHNNMQPPADMVHGYPPGAGGYCPPGGGY